MTDNDSLRPEDFEPHRAKPEQVNIKNSFSEAFQQRPMLRVGLFILPVIVVIAIIFSMFGHKKVENNASVVAPGADLKAPIPGTVVPKAYNEAVEQVNQERTETAKQNGDSAIPTQFSATQGTTQVNADPMANFVAPPPPVTPTQTAAPAEPASGPGTQVQPQQPQVDQAKLTQISTSMQAQMQPLLTSEVPKSIKIMAVAPAPVSNADLPTYQNGADQRPTTKPEGKIIVTAGTVSYGQTLTEANSDVPAPILVSILSGPFAGCRAIATFQKTPDYLIMAFGTIIKDKLEYHVNALATDPETTLTALETSTDHHYFDRFVLPAAAAFIAGIGQSVATEGTTVTENQTLGGGSVTTTPTLNTHQQILVGLGAAAQSLSNAVSQDSNRQPTIHVASGTPIGILFVNSVHEITE